MKQTLASRLLRKFQPKPTREAQPVVRYLRSHLCTDPPDSTADVLASLMGLAEALEDFPELDALLERQQAALREFKPGEPPASPVTFAFFSYLTYFAAPYGNQKETLGTVLFELCRAYSIHPQRLKMMEALNRCSIGWFQHEGPKDDKVLLRDLSTGRLLEIVLEVEYQGEAGEVWLGCLVEGETPRWVTKPYVLRGSNGQAPPRPKQWIEWLEWIQACYTDHTSQAIFLELPESSDEEAPEGCFSLAQRWAPLVIQEEEEEEPVRPHLLLLVDEAGQRVQAFHQQDERFRPEQIQAWLEQQRPRPEELWVDDPALQAYLEKHWRFGPCRLKTRLPRFQAAWRYLSRSLATEEGSLLELLGPQRARRFYRSAHAFFASNPWDHLSNEDCLAYQDQEGTLWGVVVMGSGGEEFGLALYSSPSEAIEAIQGAPAIPTLSFALAEEWLVPAQDLDFLESCQLRFLHDLYPWLCYRLGTSRPPQPRHAHLVHWLLENIPEFIRGGRAALVRDQCSLALLARPRAGFEQTLYGALLTCWGKKSRHAEMLAELLVDFASDELDGLELPEVLPRLVSLGQEYLAVHGRKRSVVIGYFTGPTSDPILRRFGDYLESVYPE